MHEKYDFQVRKGLKFLKFYNRSTDVTIQVLIIVSLDAVAARSFNEATIAPYAASTFMPSNLRVTSPPRDSALRQF